jgi:hypothetical protein
MRPSTCVTEYIGRHPQAATYYIISEISNAGRTCVVGVYLTSLSVLVHLLFDGLGLFLRCPASSARVAYFRDNTVAERVYHHVGRFSEFLHFIVRPVVDLLGVLQHCRWT